MTLHDIAVAIFWVLLAAKTVARTAMAVAFSFAFEVSQHVSLGEENMSSSGTFSVLPKLTSNFAWAFAMTLSRPIIVVV